MDMPPDFETDTTIHFCDKTLLLVFSSMSFSYLCICVLLCMLDCVERFVIHVRVNMVYLFIALINVFIIV